MFEFLGTLHRHLHDSGVPIPLMFKDKHGKYVNNSCVLYEFIEGRKKRRWSNQEMISLVENFSKLHNVLDTIPVPSIIKEKTDDYIRGENIIYSKRNIVPEVLKLNLPLPIKNEVSMTLSLLEKHLSDYDALPKRIIHGDFNDENALFRGNKNVAIIDITLKHEALVFDLAIFIYWWCFPWWTKHINFERYKLVLKYYKRNRQLTVREKKLLPYLILRRSFLVLTYPSILYIKDKKDYENFASTMEKNFIRNREIRENLVNLIALL